jgi:hypothetical protein
VVPAANTAATFDKRTSRCFLVVGRVKPGHLMSGALRSWRLQH